MRIVRRVGVVSFSAVAALGTLLVVRSASAQGAAPPPAPPPPAAAPPAAAPPPATSAPATAAPPATATPTTATAAPPAAEAEHEKGEHGKGEHGKDEHHEHPTVHLGLDAVIGFGKLAIAEQGPAVSGNQMPAFGIGRAKVVSTSFLLGGSVEVAHGVHVGARFPLSYASFSPETGGGSRGTSAAGNLEIEGAYHHHIDKMMHLAAGLGIALPTAQGSPLPEVDSLAANNPQLVQQNDMDRRAVNRASAASRGWEENALFTPHYLGIIPQLHFGFQMDQFHVDPWVKLEYLVRVAAKDLEEHSSIAELVLGTRFAYDFTKELQGALRVWGNIGFTSEKNEDGTTSKPAVGVLEPQVRGHFGTVSPYVGVLVPFAGKALTDPRWTGVRLGVSVGFLGAHRNQRRAVARGVPFGRMAGGRESGKRRTKDRDAAATQSRPVFTREHEELRERQRMMTRVYMLGCASWVAFAAVDLFAALALAGGANVPWLLAIRGGGAVVAFGGYFLLRSRPLGHAALTGVDVVVFFTGGGCLALMAIPFGGIDSTFIQGVMVLTSARAALLPTSLSRCLPVTLGTTFMFPLTLVLAAPFFPAIQAQWSDRSSVLIFVHNFLFASAIAVFGALGSQLVWQAKKQVHEARRLGGYRLKMRIATGGTGEVWLARQDALDRHVALKILKGWARESEESIRRFEREARAASRLSHPNTVRVFDFGASDDGVVFLAMELLDGLNLDALVTAAGPLPPARAIALARQACGSLAEAHDNGIIHRDIKPANLFVAQVAEVHDVIKLLDFGLARVTDRDGAITISESNRFGGTPAYMAPEVVESASADERADLYALGGVLYFMLTGTVLFPDRTVSETLMMQVGSVPETPSQRLGREVPADLERVVMKCLAKQATDRYRSARELEDDLARCGDADKWTKRDATGFWTTFHSSMHMRAERIAG